MSTPLATRNTAAYYLQAVASFIVSAGATVVGIAYLPVNAWERAFLGLGLLYTITSAITLAKVVRDKQEEVQLVGRVEKARLDKLLTEHDPYRVDAP
ncbi:YiaA/YiaB family inner membrane protein [Catenulispora pinisilvae]|uniref:YiaA/YiaB family inner membrane protein n=1 Tax=Catenulispora pinisilvae TaxID=2705253 RepID=UPI0018927175|nr:YiaA/YiaB family inner membrane protein [Catenulispora pinisilvae]